MRLCSMQSRMLLVIGLVFTSAHSLADEAESVSRLRRPIALSLAAGGKRLLVANRSSGTISIIDSVDRKVVGEFGVAARLTDLIALPDRKHWLALDDAQHEVILLRFMSDKINVEARMRVAPFPVRAVIDPQHKLIIVASLWARQLTVLRYNLEQQARENDRIKFLDSVDLPFAPHEMLALNEKRKIIVADAFGGQLAVVDLHLREVEHVHSIPAHNIGGLELDADGKSVLMPHQILNSLARTTANDVHWGLLMTNTIRILQLADVLSPKGELLNSGSLIHLGEIGNAAADPGNILVTSKKATAVVLGGTGEVAVSINRGRGFFRIQVGKRPTRLCCTENGEQLFVANTLSDSVSIVELSAEPHRVAEISLGPRPKLSSSARGEILFFDAALSHDSWMSCNSCHVDGHTNGLLNDNLSDGGFGASKRVLSLLGVKDTRPWSWAGDVKRLEDQIHKSVGSTMRGVSISERQASDLAAFLKTLSPPPSVDRLRQRISASRVRRGRRVFEKQGCARCHAEPQMTTANIYDVGVRDEVGTKRFNPPSLRGVSQGRHYLHDNRAKSLRSLFEKHRHQLDAKLTGSQLDDLIAFLRSL